jgi:hypothetical protein
MTWTTGARVVVGCGCPAVVEWRAPRTASLYAVRIDRGVCGARRHTAGQRILASIGREEVVPTATNDERIEEHVDGRRARL